MTKQQKFGLIFGSVIAVALIVIGYLIAKALGG